MLHTGIINPGTRQASRLQGEADLDIGINRAGAVGLDIGDHFVRSDRTVTTVLGVGALSLFNEARAQLNLRPGGGALSFEPNYHLATELFSPFSAVRPAGCAIGNPACDPTAVDRLNYLNHTVGLSARWKFLPKTAVVLDSQFGYRTYIAGGAGAPLLGLKASAGLAGLLTSKLTTTLKLGWGQDFTNGSYSSLIGMAELGYLVSETAQVRARTCGPSSRWAVTSSVSATTVATSKAGCSLAGRLSLKAYGAYDRLSFRGAAPRVDHNITGDVGGNLEITQWLGFGLGYQFTNRASPEGRGSLACPISSGTRSTGACTLSTSPL